MRLVSTVCIIALILSANALFAPFAYGADEIVIEAESYSEGTILANWGNALRLYNNNAVSYAVDLPKEGIYSLTVRAGSEVQNDSYMSLYINGELIATATITPTGSFNTYRYFYVGSFSVDTEGEAAIRFSVTTGNISFDSFTISPVSELEITDCHAGASAFSDGDVIARGTDCFLLTFSNPLAASEALASTVYIISDSGEMVSSVAKASDTTLLIYLKQTLRYSQTYFLEIGGICDTYGQVFSGSTLHFSTSGETADFGEGYVYVDSASVDGRSVVITGVVYGSGDYGIEGRTLSVSITNAANEIIATDESVSGAGGAFAFRYEFSETAESGDYNFSLRCEYSAEETFEKLKYISEQTQEEVLALFRTALSVGEVISAFEILKDEVGYDYSPQLQELSDTSLFYRHFIKLSVYNMDAFSAYAETCFLLETLMQQPNIDILEDTLNSSEKCELLGLDGIKAEFIVNNRDEFLSSLAQIGDCETLEGYLEAFNVVLDAYFLAESEKADAILKMNSVSATAGQGVILDLSFNELQSDVIGMQYIIEADDEAIFDITDNRISLPHSITRAGNKLIIDFTFSQPMSFSKPTGDFTITMPDVSKSYVLKMSGAISFLFNTYTVSTAIVEKKVTIAVKAANKGYAGGSSSGVNAGVSAAVSIEVNEQSTEQPTNEHYAFSDIDSVSWAIEGIEFLTECGIIARDESYMFRPMDSVKREEFAKLIVLAFGAEYARSDIVYSDVNQHEWYYSYISAAHAYGLIYGYENGSFGIGESITREDMCVIVFRALERMGYTIEQSEYNFFDDHEEISDYAKIAVCYVRERGIINGVGENIFSPKAPVTRAMAAKIIYETMEAVGL